MKIGWNCCRKCTSLLFGLVALGVLTTQPAAAGQSASSGVTFAKDVAPILQRACQNCHRPGGVGPMSLLSFEDVRPWARSIKLKTGKREMPPWFIEKDIGIQKFKDDISLTDEEISTIARWVDGGAPRGNPADMPPPRQFADAAGWSFGTPDLVVSSPVVTVNAVAPDYHGFLKPAATGLTEDRYIKAVEVKEFRLEDKAFKRTAGQAGDLNLFVVHHAVISTQKGPQDGTGDDVVSGSEVSSPGRDFHLTHELGQNATIYPDDVGVRLPAKSALGYKVHLHSVGREVPVRIDVAFKFHPSGYKPKYTFTSAGASSGYLRDLDIPAGADNVRFDSVYTLSKPGRLVTFEPHMHASGKRMCVEATYPSGRREMLNCAGYNHNWVKVYSYEDDVAPLLPAGTILHVIGWYDNSANNPRNIDPRNWKGYGNRSVDDMFLFLGRMVALTEEQFIEEVAVRAAKQRQNATSQQ